MVPTARPLQKLSWNEKISKDYQWFKNNIDWGVQTSHFHSTSGTATRGAVILGLYNIYNSRFPASWFTHIMNPFSAKKEEHKNWGGKIRPQNIIRPNVELLRGEYPKRPFPFQIVVKGEQGYNNFLEARKKAVFDNLSQTFINGVNQGAQQTNPEQEPDPTGQQQPGQMDTQVPSQPVSPPQSLVDQFANEYRDMLAEQAQDDLDLIMDDQSIKEKLEDILKDYLIAGEARSYKGVIRDKTVYERISPLELDHDKSATEKYIKNGSWACRRTYMVVPDIVDRFYDSLKSGDIDDIENMSALTSPASLYNYLENSETYQYNKVPVYHFTWKSFQKIGFLKGTDPTTGEEYADQVGEDYVVNPDLGESIEWEWVVQVLEGYRIGDKIYTEMGPPTYQPNQISNFSKHELGYNGFNFSDTHAENLSVVKLGIPFQIMYCIMSIVLERTITKSRGKIALIDKNSIPNSHGWDEEKFFYYAEAQGWALIDRNQQGVDKSAQVYQVMDLSTFQHISEIIKIMDYCKEQNDDQFGISRQRKAETTASDTVGGNAQALFQSSVITEMIFAAFDKFVKTEIEGLINCSQISNRNGKKAAFVTDDARTKLLDINPDYYCYAELGIMVEDSANVSDALKRIRQYTQAFAQNGQDPITIIEVETANNISKLKGILAKVKQAQIAQAQQEQQTEHEQEVAKIQIAQQFKEYENLLEIEKMNQEYTRKEELVILQGDINLSIQEVANGMNPDTTDGTDISEIMARQNERDQMFQDKEMHSKTEDNKVTIEKAKLKMEERKNATKQKEIESKERTAKASKAMDLRIAKAKPKPKPAKR